MLESKKGVDWILYYSNREEAEMNWIGNVIVGMWFIPVALFIVIPLAAFAGNLLVQTFRQLFGPSRTMNKHHPAAPGKMWA